MGQLLRLGTRGRPHSPFLDPEPDGHARAADASGTFPRSAAADVAARKPSIARSGYVMHPQITGLKGAGACWSGSTSSTTGSRRSRPGTTASGSSATSSCGAKAPSTRCTTPAPCSSSGSTTRRGRDTWWSTTASAPVVPGASAGSGVLWCEGLGDEWAAVMVAQPLPKLLAGELAVGLDHGPLPVRPAGLDRVQPRALARQAADEEAAAAPGGLDPAVVGRGPGPPPPAGVPRGGVPHHGPGPDAPRGGG